MHCNIVNDVSMFKALLCALPADMISEECSPAISLHEYVIRPTYPGSEPIYLHITKMKDAYMLWAGTAQSAKLNDWVVSMPMPSGLVGCHAQRDSTE